MTQVSRRDLIKGGAGALALATLTPCVVQAAEGPSTALFVFDARFPLSHTAAQDSAANGAALFDPRDGDLGVAWRSRIPQVLAGGGGVAGLTLWSDCLISQIFAREQGLAFGMVEVPQATGLPLFHWQVQA